MLTDSVLKKGVIVKIENAINQKYKHAVVISIDGDRAEIEYYDGSRAKMLQTELSVKGE